MQQPSQGRIGRARAWLRGAGTPLERQVGLGPLAAIPAAFIVWFSVVVIALAGEVVVLRLWPLARGAVYPALLVSALLAAWLGKGIARFCSRVIAPRADGGPRVFLGVACALGAISLWLGVLLAVLQTFATAETAAVVTATAAWAVGITRLGVAYLRPSTRKPYILFLRSFHSFSDRAIMSCLFRAAGGAPILSVSAPTESSGAWDPVTVCFRGNSLLRPLGAGPIFLRAPASDWDSAVRRLIRGARKIVVDVSEHTPGVELEVSMIEDERASERVVWCCEGTSADATAAVEQYVDRADRPLVVNYQRSFAGAILPVSFGFAVSVLFFLVLPLAALAAKGQLSPLDFSRPGYSVGLILGRVAPAFTVAAGLFLRQDVDGSAVKRLRAALA